MVVLSFGNTSTNSIPFLPLAVPPAFSLILPTMSWRVCRLLVEEVLVSILAMRALILLLFYPTVIDVSPSPSDVLQLPFAFGIGHTEVIILALFLSLAVSTISSSPSRKMSRL